MLGTRSFSVLVIALALLAASVAPPAGAAARQSVRTTVVMKDWQYHQSSSTYRVPGVVRSKRAVCERNRTVKLVGPAVKRRDRTDRVGRWSVRIPAGHVAIGGTFRAIAPRKVVRKNGRAIVCARGLVIRVVAGG